MACESHRVQRHRRRKHDERHAGEPGVGEPTARALLGSPRGGTVVPVTDDPALAAAVTAPAGKATVARYRASGFSLATPVVLTPASDLAAIARTIVGASPAPAVALVLAAAPTATALAQQLAVVGYTGTVAVGESLYQPTAPLVANGLTVLVPIAPFEEATPANRRLAADVESFAPGTPLTTAIASGYWSADLFVRALGTTGKALTRERVLRTLNGAHFTYEVADTVGRSSWPEMHAQPVPCGSLLQSDGTRYLVMKPYSCATTTAAKGK